MLYLLIKNSNENILRRESFSVFRTNPKKVIPADEGIPRAGDRFGCN